MNTHALRPASLEVLRRLRSADLPSHEVNPGVADRLTREGLAEAYITGARRRYRITGPGRAFLDRMSGLGA